VVTAENGTTTKTYTIVVTRLSSDANLSNLTVNPGSLSPGFGVDTLSYDVSVANSVSSINVTATRSHANASITIKGEAATSGTAKTVSGLVVGSNSIPVVVTAQDGTTKTYTITVTRLSSDATLSNLTVSVGTLSPTFSSGNISYAVSVGYAQASIDVTATRSHANASITINGETATSGTLSTVTLSAGTTNIPVIVTAQDGTTKTYTIAVTKAGSGTITVSFTSNLTDEAQALDINPGSSLSWKNNTAISLSVGGSWDGHQWYVDGVALAGATTSILTKHAQDFSLAQHSISVRVLKGDTYYSKTVTFTVASGL
jgi:hypothetical protein